ncbi:MAG: cell filamentation protein Fic, partial [Paludibacteraceae bacterium]|nr:cell filamentation protein Fic [Paludibacteraceae bacterium]
MEYISVREFAERHGVAERTVRNYCALEKIEGAFLTGKTWSIPEGALLPDKKRVKQKQMPLLVALQEEKQSGLKGGIYHYTQIELTYNSNHIEGRRLTQAQTRYIFETNTIGVTQEGVNVD